MIRDLTLKVIFIPFIGLLLPLISGLVAIPSLSKTALFLSIIFFLPVSFFIWQATIAITSYVRRKQVFSKSIFYRLGLLIVLAGFVSAVMAFAFAAAWQLFTMGSFQQRTLLSFSLCYWCVAVFISLVYEVLFLFKEAELESKVVSLLDMERQHAEMHVLKNELDPHFIFNSLTALSYLIGTDAEKAKLFNSRLAQTYKYFLVNKDRDLIPLEEELHFIKAYFFLLQIRFDHHLKLEIHIDDDVARQVMILPCALQILIENAIKHNCFTSEKPLQIAVYMHKNQLHVANNIVGKSVVVPSTKIGLKNLSTRYRLICRQDITINKNKDNFLVKLPVIKPSEV